MRPEAGITSNRRRISGSGFINRRKKEEGRRKREEGRGNWCDRTQTSV
ncbi:hypothetical protein [Microcoleus sp. bin38.metabat.b11b12b14.051]|nr:hypothetical protein [Microcoleus sp. bin38.metabat.b11b12b14.051]